MVPLATGRLQGTNTISDSDLILILIVGSMVVECLALVDGKIKWAEIPGEWVLLMVVLAGWECHLREIMVELVAGGTNMEMLLFITEKWESTHSLP